MYHHVDYITIHNTLVLVSFDVKFDVKFGVTFDVNCSSTSRHWYR